MGRAKGALAFQGVSFRYGEESPHVLKNLDMRVSPGECEQAEEPPKRLEIGQLHLGESGTRHLCQCPARLSNGFSSPESERQAVRPCAKAG